jgi:hypothetical protein
MFDLLEALLGEVPVLAELAAVVAAGCAGAKDGSPGDHVKGRLFLNGIYLQCAGVAVDEGVVDAAGVDLVAAESSFSLRDGAVAKAHLALDASAIEPDIMKGLMQAGWGGSLRGGSGALDRYQRCLCDVGGHGCCGPGWVNRG